VDVSHDRDEQSYSAEQNIVTSLYHPRTGFKYPSGEILYGVMATVSGVSPCAVFCFISPVIFALKRFTARTSLRDEEED
jgi:hypothetical protein